MNKFLKIFGAAAVMTAAMSMTALAGQWRQDSAGWWWQEDDGSYARNTWQWLDGNQDGVYESYYFDDSGLLARNTVTPDGWEVNEAGQWIVDGAVQTRETE